MKGKPRGKPPTEWTVKYWQWIYSKPKNQNPLKNGEIYSGDFICLPCTGGGEDCGRKISLSGLDAQKNILIPVFASECSTAEIGDDSEENLRSTARELSSPINMEASLDSVPLTPYYLESKIFNLDIPPNHSLENPRAKAGTYKAVSCGYWHRLMALPKGKHLVKFGGSGSNGFFTRVIYEIDVS